MKNFNETGRSMVEMLGVLAIIGVLSVGGIAGYSKAMSKYKINKTTDQVSMLVANIRTLFSSQGDYEDLNNAKAIEFGVVQEDMYDAESSSDEIENAFGGTVFIYASGGRKANDDEAFMIVYSGLPKEACITLATGDWGSGESSGLIGIAAAGENATAESTRGAGSKLNNIYTTTTDGTANVSIPGANTMENRTPMTVTKATGLCSATGSKNSVGWKYY